VRQGSADLCSQPTIGRLENLPGATALKRMMAALVELFRDSFEQVPRRILLDSDDTEDRVQGGRQLSPWNAHYDSRCFPPIHIYEAASGKPVAVIPRPGKTPDDAEVAHKLYLASDRTSCRTATANQFRLLIRTAACWLMPTLRGVAPRTSFWRGVQFDTIRLCLIKVAGRVAGMVTRIKVALPSAFPCQAGCASPAGRIAKLPPQTTGPDAPEQTCRRSLKPRSPASPMPRKSASWTSPLRNHTVPR
jgi:hypothetical protein